MGTWDIRDGGQWLRSTSEMTKLCFFCFFLEVKVNPFIIYIYIHLFCVYKILLMTKDMCGVCVCVLNNRCCLSSLTLTFCFLVMPWSCGWPFVVTHTFCSFESASRLLHCMHFVDCIISLMSQVPIFSHGLFKKHGVWSRVFPRTDIISTSRAYLAGDQHLKLPCFSSTRSLLFYPPSFF